MMRAVKLVWVGMAWMAAGAVLHGAPQGEAKLAIVDPAEADEDFAFQGEFAGWMASPACGGEAAGLQVVAGGSGQFQATLYSGGLPGAGWDGCRKRQLEGVREGGVVSLSGEDLAITVQPGAAAVHDTTGHLLGQLQRVRRVSPMLGACPPAGAIVLFDGDRPRRLEGARVVDGGLLAPGFMTAMPVRDFHLHLEFRTPYMPAARGQARGNSGVYIQRRYEVQILDSFGLEGEANECGGLYKQARPDVNMCLPPLTWQTYDIDFQAARWCGEQQKLRNARITVLHNGVAVHWNREITAKTGAGQPEGPEDLPIYFQDHHNPVRFRNIWIVPYEEASVCCRSPRPCGLLRSLFRRRCWRLFR